MSVALVVSSNNNEKGTYIHTYIHIYIHTYIHTYIQDMLELLVCLHDLNVLFVFLPS